MPDKYPISPDNGDFEQIFQALSPGLVLVTCSVESLRTLGSFCSSLTVAATRCGSHAANVSPVTPRINWEAVGNQIAEQGSRGVRVFLINRFSDTTPAGVLARINSEPGFDGLDGSIHSDIAEMLQKMAVGNACTLVLTTPATKEDQISERRVARILGRESGMLIALDQGGLLEDWYSATVTTEANEKRYGPLYFS